LGCLGDIMILRAILDYELSLKYDIRASVLKLLWCLDNPKGIDGYYLSIKFCKCWAVSVILKKPHFVNVWMPRWFYDLECNSRLWIVTKIWYKSLSFETIMMSRWPERNWQIICHIKFCECLDASVILWS